MKLGKRINMAECGIEKLATAFGMEEMTLVYMLQDKLEMDFQKAGLSKLHKEIITELKFSFTPTE